MPHTFVDPRNEPRPAGRASLIQRITSHPEDLNELHQLCREGRLYDVERWIRDGRPLQSSEDAPPRRGKARTSALEIALEQGSHALMLLLLCNGYDPNLEETGSPLDRALRARRWDLLDLLLAWDADPHHVDLDELFGTYDTTLFQRFMDLGVDFTADHELAAALAYHTSNKPLFGFARRHRRQHPKIQTELNIALGHHAARGNEKGVSLCLWAGADPHAPAPSLRYSSVDDPEDDQEEAEDRFRGFTAIHEACSWGHSEILKKLRPDPAVDDFEDLFRWAENSSVVEALAAYCLPQNVSSVISTYLGWWPFREDTECVYKLRALFRGGARWMTASKEEIENTRRAILKLSHRVFEDVMELLAEGDNCSAEIRSELARTPSIRKRMQEVGFYPTQKANTHRYSYHGPRTSRQFLAKYGIELPKPPPPPLPRTVFIGSRRASHEEVELDRPGLFDRVWSTPIVKLAAEWGLSDRGLAKACQRLKIPVPPRGYWAKKAAGQRTHRPPLPPLQGGEAEIIIVWQARSEAVTNGGD